jgi:hypothetical protein
VATSRRSVIAALVVATPAVPQTAPSRVVLVQAGHLSPGEPGYLAQTGASGNPFGLEGSMSFGIVSAVGRSLPVGSGTSDPSGLTANYTIPDIIQTDAPVNPGNSGGVLLDLEGQLLGVPTAIESSVRSSAGVGYAVPNAIQVVNAIMNTRSNNRKQWLSLYLIAAKSFDVVRHFRPEQVRRFREWRAGVVQQIEDGTPEYLRPGRFDAILSLLFPAMAAGIAHGKGRAN